MLMLFLISYLNVLSSDFTSNGFLCLVCTVLFDFTPGIVVSLC